MSRLVLRQEAAQKLRENFNLVPKANLLGLVEEERLESRNNNAILGPEPRHKMFPIVRRTAIAVQK